MIQKSVFDGRKGLLGGKDGRTVCGKRGCKRSLPLLMPHETISHGWGYRPNANGWYCKTHKNFV